MEHLYFVVLSHANNKISLGMFCYVCCMLDTEKVFIRNIQQIVVINSDCNVTENYSEIPVEIAWLRNCDHLRIKLKTII